MERSSCSYCIILPFMVDSIHLPAVCGQLKFFRSMQLSSLYWQCAAYDGFIKLQFENFTQTVAKPVLKFLLLSYLSLFVYTSSSFIDFRRISKNRIIWCMLTKIQLGRRSRSRVGQSSFAIELDDFISLLNGNPKLVESIKI